MRPPSNATGEGTVARLIFQAVVSQRIAPLLAETPATPLLPQYTYIRSPPNSIGITDEWVIFHAWGFGVCHSTLPVSPSSANSSAFLPPGARITVSFSISGHCPAYQGGIVAPYCLTRSMPQRSSPVMGLRQATWHLGPIVTTNFSLTAGIVRDIPWFRFTATGYAYLQISRPSSSERQRSESRLFSRS